MSGRCSGPSRESRPDPTEMGICGSRAGCRGDERGCTFCGAGKATASPRPPRRFDVVALRRLSGGNIRYQRCGCWGVPGCACAAGAVPHRRNRRRRLFPSIRTPSNTVQTPAMTVAGASLRAEPTEGNWNLPSKRRTQSSGRKKTSQQSPASAPCVSCGAPSCTAADAGAMHVGV